MMLEDVPFDLELQCGTYDYCIDSFDEILEELEQEEANLVQEALQSRLRASLFCAR